MSEWLIDTLVATSLIMAVILLLRGHVARLFGPAIAYGLWLVPAARLLMPGIQIEAAVPVTDATTTISTAISDSVRDAVMVGAQSPVRDVATQAASVDYSVIGISLWLGGAALLFIVQMFRYVSMRDELLSEAICIGEIEGISLLQTDRVSGPLAFGLFRPFIAVPQNFMKVYPSQEQEMALAHEVAHHKSGDLLVNLVAFIYLSLFWFNPLAWISWHAFRFDQEAACDARVLCGRDCGERQVYGRALARSAQDGLPTFATALNSPKTIIARLRRLSMDDISNKRRLIGRIGIFTAIGLVLPLTATVSPAVGQAVDAPLAPMAPEAPAAPQAPQAPQAPKIIKVIHVKKHGHGSSNMGTDEDMHVRTIIRDGKTIKVHTNGNIDDEKIEKTIEKAQAMSEKHQHKAEMAHEIAEKHRYVAEKAYAMANIIPEIEISEIKSGNCKKGTPVTSNVSGFDGKNKASVKLVMCGPGSAKLARAQAAKGLREALTEIRNEKDMPDSVRKEVIENLKAEIKRLDKETS